MSSNDSSSVHGRYSWWEIANCYYVLREDSAAGWNLAYCTTRLVEYSIFIAIFGILIFLLVFHCMIYKKINRRWSWAIFKTNRMLVLTLSLVMVSCMIAKMTHYTLWMDLSFLIIA